MIRLLSVFGLGALLSGVAVAQTKVVPVKPPVGRNGVVIIADENTGTSSSSALQLSMKLTGAKSGKKSATRTIRSTEDGQAAPIGELLEVCFQSNSAGFVTLWSYGSDGTVTLLYPNKFSHKNNEPAAEIKADEQVCLGKTTRFRLQVEGPAGSGRISLVLTKTPEGNVPADAYPEIVEKGQLAKQIATRRGSGVRAAEVASYQTTTLDYRIVNATGGAQ